MSTYAVIDRIDRRRPLSDDRYLDHSRRLQMEELGRVLVRNIKIGAPTMVQIESHEVENYDCRCLELGYLVEIVQCREHRMRPMEMDGFTVLMPRQIERPRPIFIDRPVRVVEHVDKIVEVDRPQPTFWQRITNHLSSLAAEVQYDGGYGEPE